MSDHGICHLPLAPLRAEPGDASEMVSQLLFGQTFDILRSEEKWSLIQNRDDGYQGYIGNKQFVRITDDELCNMNSKRQVVNSHDVFVTDVANNNSFLVPFGSVLPEEHTFRFGGKEYRHNFFPSHRTLLETAYSFLNAPYLWGGKSLFGIDCSGFTQNVFSAQGIQLFRDASQQVDQGTSVEELACAHLGDLLFFDNDKGKIIHVGILYDSTHIIHASGCVRIDSIDTKGIFNNDLGQYTHRLAQIRRIVAP